MRLCIIAISLLTLPAATAPVLAQRDSAAVYHLRPWVDGPLCAVGGLALYTGLHTEANKPPLTTELVAGAQAANVPAFDRAALRIDPTRQQQALAASDGILFTSMAAPLLLVMDRHARNQWGEVLTLYVETATLVGGGQAWTCLSTGRYRPITYIESATWEQRTNSQNCQSFFSGHTASTAAGVFFMAAVLDDLHPELGRRNWMLYAAAGVPTVLVAYFRVEAGKHFPSDVVTGACVGAAAGILIPRLHRAGRADHLSLLPIASPDLLGLSCSLRLR